MASYKQLRQGFSICCGRCFHEWIGMVGDIWRAAVAAQAVPTFLREPGWSHDGSRETSDIDPRTLARADRHVRLHAPCKHQ